MRKTKSLFMFLASISLVAVTLAGCGGSSGSGGTPATSGSSSSSLSATLSIAEKVTVVDAKSSDTAASFMIGNRAVSDLASTSDYNTDSTDTYVEERSAEAFDLINEILCMFAQTGYEEMVNKGNYKAQIDVDRCSSANDDASSQGESAQNQSSGSNATEYEYWTVNSSRADTSSPQIVKMWIHEDAEDDCPDEIPMCGEKYIEALLTITEGKSDTNPYGIFKMDFRGYPVGNSSETIMTGFMLTELDSSNNVLLKFYSDGGDDTYSFTEKVTLSRAADGSSGTGKINTAETNPWEGSRSDLFDIAYNDNYFYRTDGSSNVCLDRQNPEVTAWRYGMYYDEDHSTPGSRVSINSGFPVKTSAGDYGWIGYYGLWFPDDVTINTGDEIIKDEFGSDSAETTYTAFVARGRLKRNTRMEVTLGEIKNVPLSWNECTDDGSGNWSCIESRVEWNGSQLMKNATRSENTDWVWQEMTTPTEVVFDTNAWDFNFWSDSLGGSGRINLMDNTGNQTVLSDTTIVVFHVEDTVYPGDNTVPTELACFENCLDPSTINSADPHFTASTWQDPYNFTNIDSGNDGGTGVAPADLVPGTNYLSYTFNPSTMELEYNSVAAVMTSNSNNQNGTWSGAMFEPTASNMALLACDYDSTKTCPWQIWDKMDVFYTWETGTQQWNRLTALKDTAGDYISFDPPLNVEYTHTWSANSGKTGTSKFYLEYNGMGDIQGIPGICVDMDTGEETDCWDETGTKFIRWVPEFTIPDGSVLTDSVDGSRYYVKALEKEEIMTGVDESNCIDAGLSLENDFTLPDSSLFESPDLGDEPTVSGAPAVIAGEVQG